MGTPTAGTTPDLARTERSNVQGNRFRARPMDPVEIGHPISGEVGSTNSIDVRPHVPQLAIRTKQIGRESVIRAHVPAEKGIAAVDGEVWRLVRANWEPPKLA